MTPEEHQMLVDTKALTEENAKILKSIHRISRVSATFKIVYWVIVLGITFGAFYFIQPYFDAIKGALGNTETNGNSSSNYEELLRDL